MVANLVTMKNELNNFTWANRYKEYLSLREKGLKKPAQAELEKFILDFYKQNKLARRDFIDCIYRIGQEANDYTHYIPYNLSNQVIAPELKNWREDEPQNPIPYRWSSDFDLLKKSVELDPFDQISLDLFFTRLKNKISLNQHEVEFGFHYDGNPQEDYNLISKYEKYIGNIKSQEKSEKLKHEFSELKETALKSIKP